MHKQEASGTHVLLPPLSVLYQYAAPVPTE